MSVEVLTPYNRGDVQLSGKTFRKQILPMRPIQYHGRTLEFDRQYLNDLVDNFEKKAFPQVPFQLADKDNNHTNDPERTRGSLVQLEAADDGLYGTFELTDAGAEVVQNNPNLGVSARIIENLDREDEYYNRALQHVLGTVDPHVKDMRPWEAASLTADSSVDQTIDLVDGQYTQQEAHTMPKTNHKSSDTGQETGQEGDKVTVELSQTEHERLLEMLSDYEKAAEFSGSLNDSGGEGEEDPEPVPASKPAAKKAPATKTQQREATLTRDSDPKVTELANQVTQLNRELNESKITAELEQMQRYGIAPAIIEAARPLLEVQQPVELNRGGQLDVTDQTRKLLSTVIKLARKGEAYVELDSEDGQYVGSDSVQARREELLKAWENDQVGQ